jgi:hypothetical protein
MRSIDIPPQTVFGRLTAIREARTADGRRAMLCQCECGRTKVVANGGLRSGRTKSCGCLRYFAAGLTCRFCERPAYIKRRRLCKMHYNRFLKHGDPLDPGRRRGDGSPAAFEAKVDRSGGPDACHLWQLSTDSGGYAMVYFGGELVRGHKVAWELVNGPVPPGVELDHECHNRAVVARECRSGPCPHRRCCNERHIKPKTRKQHAQDTPWSHPHPRGETHPKARLTEQQVREIRALQAAGVYQRVIAEQYGMSRPQIAAITSGRSWAWLE